MQRIIIHWTAGAYKASALDRKHYHFIIEGDGHVVAGDHPVSANAGTLISGRYAAHTLNCNTGSIGVAVAAMTGARERPFDAGAYPITRDQLTALAEKVAGLCRRYNIPASRNTVLTHAEVQPTLGIAQRGKWDITWLPGMTAPRAPVVVGDQLRAMVSALLAPDAAPKPKPQPSTPPVNTSPAPSGLIAFVAALGVAAVYFLTKG